MSLDAVEKALLTGKWDEQIQDPSLASVLDVTKSVKELLRLTLAVACLHAFVQENWTGPDLDVKPLEVISISTESSQNISEELLHRNSISELAYGGEPAYHLAKVPIFLRLSKLLLDLPYKHCKSAPWWRLRVWLVHEQVLDEPVAVPEYTLTDVEPLLKTFASHPDLAGRLILEQGILEHQLGHDKAAAEFFVRAARTTHLEYELTGAPGKRTKFQQNDVTQLVLLAESRKREGDAEPNDTANQNKSPSSDVSQASRDISSAAMPETLALNDDTLLEQTEFTSSSAGTPGLRLSHLYPASQPPLHPLDQCILLALCLNVRNTSPVHGLTAEQMSPYIARVISHPRNWSVHTMALLLRSRLEANRTRTVERATLQLQALVDQMPTADSTVSERLLHFHSIPLPSKWEMEKELALRFLSIGVIKSALEIFERLEMWEEVVKCWQAMERRDKGIAIVRDLLEGRKAEAETVISREKAVSETRRRNLDAMQEAKLWCLLGDLEPENALQHYTRAWEISRESSGRAMRSLGGYYFAGGDYPNTITCLRRAVSINPLLARSWFILGCAYVRVEDWEGARESFARCVSIDDEDAESWSNLASVYLRMGEAGKKIEAGGVEDEEVNETNKSIPFTNKMLAFRALKQGLKYSYDNWRMWSNYMIVAMDVGELSEACHALSRVVEERSAKDGAKCVDEDVLERLVDAVTRAPVDTEDAVQGHGSSTSNIRNANEGHRLLRSVTGLFERTILPRVSSPRIFRARARLLTWQGRWEEALKAYLDGYRCGVAGTMEKGETDLERWREAVAEVEDIVDVLRNLGPRTEGYNWKLQARSIVRTFVGRTRDFEDEPEWSRLAALQEELRKEE
ncbi:tetratricopeptide repeat domain 27 [Laetiporus sulphureus 93-53]|uniref:Tetratricopeptide repeat domain 27 n=1 Tax=Laetiporus sulphureus 93-53 TaxID=1314785 RepID=A0A165E8N1_9APHY|nr:tetratricopeptide repeat domain 27 [Laetiporus sulphureus 93-53]KZT06475.1 tetratricopeptide repeat domain 27 [Laetiporus sulphureus 93-53]